MRKNISLWTGNFLEETKYDTSNYLLKFVFCWKLLRLDEKLNESEKFFEKTGRLLVVDSPRKSKNVITQLCRLRARDFSQEIRLT